MRVHSHHKSKPEKCLSAAASETSSNSQRRYSRFLPQSRKNWLSDDTGSGRGLANSSSTGKAESGTRRYKTAPSIHSSSDLSRSSNVLLQSTQHSLSQSKPDEFSSDYKQ